MNTPEKPPVRPSETPTPAPASTETPGTENEAHSDAQRIGINDLTSDQLDDLYAERDQLLAELNGRDTEARERWIQKQLDETGIRAMNFRNGAEMELEPARELLAHWVAAARTMLGDAPNYTETRVSMDVKVAESPELYTLVVQRHGPGVLTPHEARQQAEAERDALRYRLDSARNAAGLHRQGLITNTELYAAIEAHDGPAQPNPDTTEVTR